jgi:hypothetical protein
MSYPLVRNYNKADSDAVWEDQHRQVAERQAEQEQMRKSDEFLAAVENDRMISPIDLAEIDDMIKERNLPNPEVYRWLLFAVRNAAEIGCSGHCTWKEGAEPFVTPQAGAEMRAALSALLDRKIDILKHDEQARRSGSHRPDAQHSDQIGPGGGPHDRIEH